MPTSSPSLLGRNGLAKTILWPFTDLSVCTVVHQALKNVQDCAMTHMACTHRPPLAHTILLINSRFDHVPPISTHHCFAPFLLHTCAVRCNCKSLHCLSHLVYINVLLNSTVFTSVTQHVLCTASYTAPNTTNPNGLRTANRAGCEALCARKAGAHMTTRYQDTVDLGLKAHLRIAWWLQLRVGDLRLQLRVGDLRLQLWVYGSRSPQTSKAHSIICHSRSRSKRSGNGQPSRSFSTHARCNV